MTTLRQQAEEAAREMRDFAASSHSMGGRVAALLLQLAEALPPDGWKLVPVEDTEAMWGGLAREIVMWDRFPNPTGKALYAHLRASGRDIPAWLLAIIPDVEHVPPKGAVAGAIYRAMLADAPAPPIHTEGEG